MAEGRRHAELGAFRIEDDDNPDRETVAWIRAEFDREVDRIKAMGQAVIPLPVRNCSVVKEGKTVINRIETGTAFDFTKVKQIMLSDPVQCPTKAGYSYCNVVLVTRKPLPLLVPYVYDAGLKNDLKHWLFVNAKMQRARHKIGTFSSV